MKSGTLLNNRYRIVETLGQGGMGAVYRAIDDTLGVQVAVKENFFEDAEFTRQFRREATILANLRHPNLPRVTDHFILEDQGQYLVMDYIDGEDLKVRLDRLGVMDQSETILIGTTICDALHYLHNQQPVILHRDLKPGNIKITSKGEIYLVDFGLAKIVQGTKKTTIGAQGLTPGYSPPEQYGSARTDERSDIYSLSATLYVSLSGVPPEDSLSRMMGKTRLTPLRDHNPHVFEEVEKVIQKGLAVQPEDRYQNAEDFRASLLEADNHPKQNVSGNKTIIKPSSMADSETRVIGQTVPASSGKLTVLHQPEITQQAKSNSNKIIAIMLIVVVIIAGLWLIPKIMNSIDSDQSADNTNSQLLSVENTTEGLLVDPSLVPGTSPALTETFSEDSSSQITQPVAATAVGGGGQIAFSSERSGLPQIWLVDVDGENLVQLTDDAGGACQPDWAPDGTKLVFVSPCARNQDSYPGSSLFLINIDGSGLTALPTFPGGDYDPSWSPDGKSILFTSVRGGGRPQIWLLDLVTNQADNLSDSVARDFQPMWSPNGEVILFTTTRLGSSQIWIMDSSGGGQNVFSRSDDFENGEAVWSSNGEVILFTQRKPSGGITWLSAATWEAGGSARGRNEFFTIAEASNRNKNPMQEAAYSPDGVWLVVDNNPEGNNYDIYILTTSGASLRRLTFDIAADYDPAWRPVQN